MKKHFIFLILFFSANLPAQTNIDSLENRLNDVSANEKIEVLNELVKAYLTVSYKKSLDYAKKSLELTKKIKSKEDVAVSSDKVGRIYYYLDDYDKSIECFINSLKIRENIGDKKGICQSYNNIGVVYLNIKNYDKALEYFLNSLKISEEISDTVIVAKNFINIGIVYMQSNNYDTALGYYQKALKIYKEIDDKKVIAGCLNNIGIIYWYLNNFNKSLEYYQKALKIKEEIGDKWGASNTSLNIGMIYVKLLNYDKASLYLKNGLNLAEEIESRHLLKDSYIHFSELYTAKEDYKKALEYYKLYTEVKDSIFTKESSDKIAEMQTKYETEKKEKENEILRKNNEIQNLEITRQRNFRNSFIVISGLILILVIVIYSRYRAKQKINKILNGKNIQIEKANAQLSDKNKQITEQKDQLSKTLTELRETQRTLVDVAHRAGMAEIATGILHNVGNVLNSVKVSSQILKERIEKSKISGLKNALGLIKEHTTDLAGYITSDEKGKLLPEYLIKVGETLENEQDTYLNELSNLHTGVDHIEEIVRVQQDYAGGSGIVESASLSKMMDDVLKMNQDIFNKHQIKVVKHFKEIVPISAEKGKLMQVFVSVIKNAWESLLIKDDRDKVITINISEDKENKCQIVDIIDNGVGVAKENLNKIFSYGFTTKKDGKGYGLHTSAIIMAKLNGKVSVHSNNDKKGAKFTVAIPNSNQGEKI